MNKDNTQVSKGGTALKGAVAELHSQHVKASIGKEPPKERQHEKGTGTRPNGPGKVASVP